MSITLVVFSYLEVATRLSSKCCERMVEGNAVNVIFRLIRSCNRSLPHMELIKYSISILLNLSKVGSMLFYLSIYGIYIAPLQGNYSKALPGPGENKSFKQLVKRAGQISWKRADFRWETIPNRGTHNRKGPILFNGCASMRHHKINSGGRAKRLSASARRSQDKKFQ